MRKMPRTTVAGVHDGLFVVFNQVNRKIARRLFMSDVNQKMELARKIAVRKVAFVRHAVTYLVVMVGLVIVNNLTFSGYQWWLWVAFGWGIGVVSHFLSAFLYQSGNMVDRIAKRELEKMNESDKT